MIKKHWPVLFAILVVIISIILGVAASNSTDAGVAIMAGVITYMVLFPLAGVLLGAWYGWRIKSPLKWIVIPAVYLGVILYLVVEGLIAGAGLMSLSEYLSIGSFTGIACLAVEAITASISWLSTRNKTE